MTATSAGEQLLSHQWDYTYWHLNSYPTLLWYRRVLLLAFFVCILRCPNIFIINITLSSEFWTYMLMSMWRICRRLWNRGLSLWQPARRRRRLLLSFWPDFCCHSDNFHCSRLRLLRRNGDLIGFSFLGITSELLMSSHIDSLIINPPVIALRHHLVFFHSILFPCISFQILFLWISFLMWYIYVYIYIYNGLYHVSKYFDVYVLCITIS